MPREIVWADRLLLSTIVMLYLTSQMLRPGASSHTKLGPHEGVVIDVENGDFHAEAVPDRTQGTMTLHVLDRTGLKLTSVPANRLVLAVDHSGHTHEFRFDAKPSMTDAAGKTSRFERKDLALVHLWSNPNPKPRFRVRMEEIPRSRT